MPPVRDTDEQIRMHLSVLAYNVENSNQRNLQDINVYSEGVMCGLLNLIWNTQLVDLNREVLGNFPAIDLLDTSNRIFIQVTSDDSLDKIRKTVEKSKKVGAEKRLNIKPKILLLRFAKRKRGATFNLSETTTFKNKDVICLNDLAHEIQNLELSKKTTVLDYIKLHIPIKPDDSTYPLEVYLLRKFFESLASLDIDVHEDSATESELEKKRERYKQFWIDIQAHYRSVLDRQREKSFKAAFDRIGEADRLRLNQYLGYESTKILDTTPSSNPNEVIEKLKVKIIADINVPLVSAVDVVHFLYYEFHHCNVLPIFVEETMHVS